MTVKPDQFDAAVEDLLAGYAADVREGVEKAVEETSIAALKEVREKSPRRSGAYAKGWTVSVFPGSVKGLSSFKVVIHNKKHYRLTHLLEKGHQKANGGRVAGIPHIAPAEEKAQELFPKLVQQAIEEAGA